MRKLPSTFTVLALAVLSLACGSGEPDPTKTKVIVLGFDGAGWDTLDPLIEAGKLPLLARLKRDAAWAPLTTFKPTKSPVIWTSIATGKSMAKHGILDFVYIEKNDIQVPYSNSERREPSVWQILDHHDRRSVVVNWFVTYPPDAIDGVMVSNRFRKTLLLPEERRARMADSVHPEPLFETLLPMIRYDYREIREEQVLPDLAEMHDGLDPDHDSDDIPVLKDYWIYVLQEATIDRVSRHLFETEEFDFFATYFRLPDIVQHTALELMEPELVERTLEAAQAGELSEDEAAAFQDALVAVLEPFYRYMESIIAHYLESADENTYVMVLSDHGFSLHGTGYDHYHIPESAPAPDGIFVLTGPGTRGGRLPAVSVYDVTPTLLHLFGLPYGESMDGAPLEAAFDWKRTPSRARYARDLMQPKEHRRDGEIDERTLEELRALGYIK